MSPRRRVAGRSAPSQTRQARSRPNSGSGTLVQAPTGFAMAKVGDDAADGLDDLGLVGPPRGVGNQRGESVDDGGECVDAPLHGPDREEMREADLDQRLVLAVEFLVGFLAAGVEG